MFKRADGAEWFTLADEARDTDVVAVSRAALAVLRDRLDSFDIDVQSDAPWPASVQGAVALLNLRRTAPKRTKLFGFLRLAPGITARLDLAEDDDYEVASAVVPYTIGCTGLAEGRILLSVNDTGRSAAFRLTSAEADEVRIHAQSLDGDPGALISMSDRRR